MNATGVTCRTANAGFAGVAITVKEVNGPPPFAPFVQYAYPMPGRESTAIGMTAEGTPAGTPSAVADSGLVPAMLFARTENRYVSPMVRSATFRLVPSVVIESTRISG